MKTILKVSRTELRTLFYSPIAWFLLVAFFVQCGIAYMDGLKSFADMQKQGGENLRYMKFLTYQMFSNPQSMNSVFIAVTKNIYLYIPLLTMGLLSRETSSGTIKLLYSSPVKARDIVYGKYLSMVIFSLMMVTLVAVFIVLGALHINNAETGLLMTSALGIFLLLCTYSAIGLFMSSLTSYQVVAAIGTFVIFGLLSYMGNVWQRYDFLRDIAYFLSMQGRTQNMLSGLVSSQDVLYFLIIIYIFVALTIFKLKSGRESRSFSVNFSRYFIIIFSGLVVGYFSTFPSLTLYYDATSIKSMTLTPTAQRIIKELGDDPLEVISYNNVLGNYAWYGHPSERKRLLSNWDIYLRFKPSMKFNIVNYYDEPLDAYAPFAKQYPNKTLKQVAAQTALGFDVAVSDFKSPEQIKQIIDLKPELNRFVMLLKWRDRSTILRIYNDMMVWPSETEVSAAFKRLLQVQLPKIGFVTGNLERNINKSGNREYKVIANDKVSRNSLVNQGFDADTVNLDNADIPQNLTALVLADPKTELSSVAIERLQQYIDAGGNLLVAGEPGKQGLLNPLLNKLNVRLAEGSIAQPSKQLSPDLVQAKVTPTAAAFTSMLSSELREDSLHVIMPGATGIDYFAGGVFTSKSLLVTDSTTSWIKRGTMVLDSSGIVFNASAGDQKRSVSTAVALTRKIANKEQRIIVLGDADFMSNMNLIARPDVRNVNFAFCTALFSWLADGEFPIDTSRPEAKDTKLNIGLKDIAKLKIVFHWVLPVLMIAFAALLLIRRNRK